MKYLVIKKRLRFVYLPFHPLESFRILYLIFIYLISGGWLYPDERKIPLKLSQTSICTRWINAWSRFYQKIWRVAPKFEIISPTLITQYMSAQSWLCQKIWKVPDVWRQNLKLAGNTINRTKKFKAYFKTILNLKVNIMRAFRHKKLCI